MDKISQIQRSKNMSHIKSVNTKPEIAVRRLLWNSGYRYRLHVKRLSGKPDIYISKIKTAIFIHGCFWHQHEGCKRKFMPKSNIVYWEKKLKNNVIRFTKHREELIKKGFNVIVIWECETKKADILIKKLNQKLQNVNYYILPARHI